MKARDRNFRSVAVQSYYKWSTFIWNSCIICSIAGWFSYEMILNTNCRLINEGTQGQTRFNYDLLYFKIPLHKCSQDQNRKVHILPDLVRIKDIRLIGIVTHRSGFPYKAER